MFRVMYVIKNHNGYLQDFSRLFESFQEAIKCVRALQTKYNGSKEVLLGKPSIERV